MLGKGSIPLGPHFPHSQHEAVTLEVLRSREGSLLGSSLGEIGCFFLEDGALSSSSGFGERRQNPKQKNYWTDT